MKVAQRLSAGSRCRFRPRPAKRVTEFPLGVLNQKNFCRPFHGLAIILCVLVPAINRWAIFKPSASAGAGRLHFIGQELTSSGSVLNYTSFDSLPNQPA